MASADGASEPDSGDRLDCSGTRPGRAPAAPAIRSRASRNSRSVSGSSARLPLADGTAVTRLTRSGSTGDGACWRGGAPGRADSVSPATGAPEEVDVGSVTGLAVEESPLPLVPAPEAATVAAVAVAAVLVAVVSVADVVASPELDAVPLPTELDVALIVPVSVELVVEPASAEVEVVDVVDAAGRGVGLRDPVVDAGPRVVSGGGVICLPATNPRDQGALAGPVSASDPGRGEGDGVVDDDSSEDPVDGPSCASAAGPVPVPSPVVDPSVVPWRPAIVAAVPPAAAAAAAAVTAADRSDVSGDAAPPSALPSVSGVVVAAVGADGSGGPAAAPDRPCCSIASVSASARSASDRGSSVPVRLRSTSSPTVRGGADGSDRRSLRRPRSRNPAIPIATSNTTKSPSRAIVDIRQILPPGQRRPCRAVVVEGPSEPGRVRGSGRCVRRRTVALGDRPTR